MSFETWLAYASAYALLSLLPGPSIFMVVSQSIAKGGGAAARCILGDLTGGGVIMIASAFGLGAVLAASGTAYSALKWCGVAYVVWLGVSQIRSARRLTTEALAAEAADVAGRNGGFAAGFLTGVLNPKAIVFYMAFLAQFVDPNHPAVPQVLILFATSSVIVALVLSGYAILALRTRRVMSSVRARKRIGYAGGSLLLGGGAMMAVSR